jgi:signal transduction histidine kinase
VAVATRLQTRLLIAVGALALAAIALVVLAARQGTRLEFVRFAEAERSRQTAELPAIAERLAPQLADRCCDAASLRAVAAAIPREAALLIVDPSSGALIASAGPALASLSRVETSLSGDTLALDVARQSGTHIEHGSLRFVQPPRTLRLADGRTARLYLVPVPAGERPSREAAFFGALDRRLVVAAVLVGLLAIGATWIVVRGVTRPVEELQAASRDLAHGRFGRRVAPRGSRETIELGESFNRMAAELERQETLRRDLVHDVAHELRTPLTDLRCRLEAVIDGLAPDPRQAVRDLHDDVRHLGRLVDDLQELAQAETRALVLDVRDVAVDDIVRAALRTAGLDADPRVSVDAVAGLVVRADADRARQIAVNLLTNAARHAPAADDRIQVAARADGDRVRIEVRNTGSRLEGPELARVFDRFYRADPARGRQTGGSGLGLAIVKQLVEAQGGETWARSDADSVTVGFSLPRAVR